MVLADKIPVLIYHEILPNAEHPGETIISLDKFRDQMKFLHDSGYSTISIDELVSFMKGGNVAKKSIVLTFDDGWKSIMGIIPILKEYQFKAAFFIFPGKGIGSPYIEWADVLSIAKDPNFEICSHSMSHPWDKNSNLVTWVDGKTAGKGVRDAEYEISESKRILEKKLTKRVKYFAWPVGWFNEKLLEMAKETGYEALFTAEDGANTKGGDVLRIKRIFIDGACDMSDFKLSLQDYKYHVCDKRSLRTQGHSPYY